jgi:Holliday junction resolvasome RuvABC DNA-binding subunit
MPILSPTNEEIAELLNQIAGLLEQQDDNPYRVQAFRHGADRVRETETSLVEIVEKGGAEALTQLEGIGQGLAGVIFEFISTGRSSYLQQVQTRQRPEEIFEQVPGIGAKLAQQIAYELEIKSLEELEQAAHDGRLRQLHGFGPRRVEAIQHSLAGILGRSTPPRKEAAGSSAADGQPSVALLLEVDAEYRRRAAADELPRLTPRRFNPRQEAWLPVLQTKREGWSMTLLFSNTAKAHELDKTHDWVVIYYQKDGPEAQCTVVTETGGPLQGKRVVRGRERESRTFYEGKKGS